MVDNDEERIDPERRELFVNVIERGWTVLPLIGFKPLIRKPFSQVARNLDQLGEYWDDWVRLAEKKISKTDPDELPHLTLNPGVVTGENSGITVLRLTCKDLEVYERRYKIRDSTGELDEFAGLREDRDDLVFSFMKLVFVVYEYMTGVPTGSFDVNLSTPVDRRLKSIQMTIHNDGAWVPGPGSADSRHGKVFGVCGLKPQDPKDDLHQFLYGNYEELQFRSWVRTKLGLSYPELDRIVAATRVDKRQGKQDLVRFAREVYPIVEDKEDLLTVVVLYAEHFHPKPRNKRKQLERLNKIVMDTELPTEELMERKVLGKLKDDYPERVSGNHIHEIIGGRREYVFQALHRLDDRGEVRQIGRAGWIWIPPDDR